MICAHCGEIINTLRVVGKVQLSLDIDTQEVVEVEKIEHIYNFSCPECGKELGYAP